MRFLRLMGGVLVLWLGLAAWCQADTTTGLFLWLPFSEGTGTTTADNATTDGAQGANLGATTRAPAWITSGCRTGSCLSFDGVDDYVQGSTGTATTVTTAVTLTAWVYPTNNVQGDVYTNGNDGYLLRMLANATPTFYIQAPSGNYTNCTHNAGLALNTWHHIAGTYDNTNIRLYINGVQSPNSPCAKTGTIAAPVAAYVIGIGNGLSINVFAGMIDNIRVYSRTLSAGEIVEDMNLGLPAAVAKKRGPLVY